MTEEDEKQILFEYEENLMKSRKRHPGPSENREILKARLARDDAKHWIMQSQNIQVVNYVMQKQQIRELQSIVENLDTMR